MNLFGVGLPEMAVILVVGLLIFGPRKLPEIGRTVAKTIKSLQSASKEFEAELRRETSNLDKPAPKAVAAIEANTEADQAATNETAVTDTNAADTDTDVTTETEVVAEVDTPATDTNTPNVGITDAGQADDAVASDVSIPEPQKVA